MAKEILFREFKGLNLDDDKINGYLPLVSNVDLVDGEPAMRKGRSKHNTTADGYAIVELFQYRTRDGVDTLLYDNANGEIRS